LVLMHVWPRKLEAPMMLSYTGNLARGELPESLRNYVSSMWCDQGVLKGDAVFAFQRNQRRRFALV